MKEILCTVPVNYTKSLTILCLRKPDLEQGKEADDPLFTYWF